MRRRVVGGRSVIRRGLAGVVALSVMGSSLLVPRLTASADGPGRVGLDAPLGWGSVFDSRIEALRATESAMVAVNPSVGEGADVPEPVDQVVGDADTGVTADVPEFVRPAQSDEPVVEYEGPAGYVEGESVVVDGTPTSLTYRNPDGSNSTHFFSDEVAFQDDETGEWRRFDNTPVVAADGRVEPAASDLEISFADSAAENDLTQLAQPDGSALVSFGLLGAADVPGVPVPGGVRYAGVFDGVDLVEHALVSGVKEDLVLAAAPTVVPVYRFAVESTDLTPRVALDGSIEFVDTSGEVIWVVPQGTAWDSDETVMEELRREPVRTVLVQDATGWVIELRPSIAWLTAPERVYPVTIDPSFDSKTGTTAANKRDAYVASGVPYGHYNGTSGTYTQYSSVAGTYVNKVGWTMVNTTWQEYQSDSLSLPRTAAR